MQSFTCPACHARVYFDNLFCACGALLYYEPEAQAMWNQAAPCSNRDSIQCNWAAVPDAALCRSCRMSDMLPALNVGDNQRLLARAERAKRWVLANLANWQWFTDADPGARPRFLMLSEHTGGQRAAQIVMGHAGGQITINVTEADQLIRLQRQHQLGEQYRSMVGHFRHELAHFLFDRLTLADGFSDAFRALFGDERADYAAALQSHYENPAAPGEDHITAYATAHPHEDWAETVAHLLHMVDFTDSFVSAGLDMKTLPADYAPYADDDADHLLSIAAEVAIAINDINRALDNTDLYPFVLTPAIREKMCFAHGWLKRHAARGA
ncbi:zinc-binding metallopeptidase family protein [Paracoccus salsus]|uniref:zinc-binding metallopeptidase family protein n=1 Tax=Paracoccus salsus TaxID=2911061 RepID=UPI001F1D7DE5|nr:putative zinc-binding metallopeptidase [Paracoccus salsus]MCF3974134.1 putative zinc-binding peptidase [Paracoccus salsus]